ILGGIELTLPIGGGNANPEVLQTMQSEVEKVQSTPNIISISYNALPFTAGEEYVASAVTGDTSFCCSGDTGRCADYPFPGNSFDCQSGNVKVTQDIQKRIVSWCEATTGDCFVGIRA
ncbi:unnamed protein product, partial [marine sediment metagenome]